MIEFLSFALVPNRPISIAAAADPITEPKTTSRPISRATAAPAKEISLMP